MPSEEPISECSTSELSSTEPGSDNSGRRVEVPQLLEGSAEEDTPADGGVTGTVGAVLLGLDEPLGGATLLGCELEAEGGLTWEELLGSGVLLGWEEEEGSSLGEELEGSAGSAVLLEEAGSS